MKGGARAKESKLLLLGWTQTKYGAWLPPIGTQGYHMTFDTACVVAGIPHMPEGWTAQYCERIRKMHTLPRDTFSVLGTMITD